MPYDVEEALLGADFPPPRPLDGHAELGELRKEVGRLLDHAVSADARLRRIEEMLDVVVSTRSGS
jgi:hypothetical protein